MINYNVNTKLILIKDSFINSIIQSQNFKKFFEYHFPVFVSIAILKKRIAVKQQKKRIKIVLVAVPLLISGFCTYEDSD